MARISDGAEPEQDFHKFNILQCTAHGYIFKCRLAAKQINGTFLTARKGALGLGTAAVMPAGCSVHVNMGATFSPVLSCSNGLLLHSLTLVPAIPDGLFLLVGLLRRKKLPAASFTSNLHKDVSNHLRRIHPVGHHVVIQGSIGAVHHLFDLSHQDLHPFVRRLPCILHHTEICGLPRWRTKSPHKQRPRSCRM